MKIKIIGSGITGITSAYYLAKNNHQVTIVDEEGIQQWQPLMLMDVRLAHLIQKHGIVGKI